MTLTAVGMREKAGLTLEELLLSHRHLSMMIRGTDDVFGPTVLTFFGTQVLQREGEKWVAWRVDDREGEWFADGDDVL